MPAIMIVDDSSVTRKVIKKHIKSGPYANVDLLEAGDGEQALATYKSGAKIDVVLSDWNMPKMNGLEFVRGLREFESTSGVEEPVKIIMITTEGTIDKVTQAMESGVNEYIVKPFTADTLTKTLKKVLPLRV
ncbi:MAG: response regulator [Candidatus Sericytochromatia bacterium]|nr:response regulator [Candidatus Sericytochromatia bacterium]